ncbi:endonuclease NucS domain-containing protein [Candidatus Mycalebacterium sp.]
MKERFTEWLIEKGFSPGTASGSYRVGINRLSKDLGEDIFQITDLERVSEIRKTYDRGGAKQEVGYLSAGSPRAAIIQYEQFVRELSDGGGVSDIEGSSDSVSNSAPRKLSLERDLHNAIESQISELFSGYKLVSSEYTIKNVRLDLLLKKGSDFLVVELKSGAATHAAFGQISMYMGHVAAKFPKSSVKGLIIAADIDPGLIAACSTNKNISCKKYKMKLRLENV